MRDIGAQLSQMSVTAEMTAAMRNATLAMQRMNAQIDMPAMRAMLRQYERESQGFDDKQKMMDETLDEVLDEEGDEMESDQMVQRILEEITLETLHAVGPVPVQQQQRTAFGVSSMVNNNNNKSE
jgi:charged multivesicular body protein 2A